MGFSFKKGVDLQQTAQDEVQAVRNFAKSCDLCITAGIGTRCDVNRCPIFREYRARITYFESKAHYQKVCAISEQAQQTKQRIAKAREQAAAAKEVK